MYMHLFHVLHSVYALLMCNEKNNAKLAPRNYTGTTRHGWCKGLYDVWGGITHAPCAPWVIAWAASLW